MSEYPIEFQQDENGIYQMPDGTPAKMVPELLNHNFGTVSTKLTNNANQHIENVRLPLLQI